MVKISVIVIVGNLGGMRHARGGGGPAAASGAVSGGPERGRDGARAIRHVAKLIHKSTAGNGRAKAH